ncbi:hypothetical protein HanRHA438_Chr01g0043781 [Helianthus annuus]|nr:hypothetical protein HanRHA438_Chr01g0043781 [Helianthus annuus]
MANTIHCKPGKFSFTFLGLPIGANMKQMRFWKPIIDKFNSKLSRWKAMQWRSFVGAGGGDRPPELFAR